MKFFCALNSDIGNEFITIDIDIVYKVKRQWFENNFLIERNRLLNKITNSYPCQIHFNGYSRAFLDDRIFDIMHLSQIIKLQSFIMKSKKKCYAFQDLN